MRRYKISLGVLRYFSTQEEKFCIFLYRFSQAWKRSLHFFFYTNEIPLQWITMKGTIFICNYGSSDFFTCEDDMLSSSFVFGRVLLCSGKYILFRNSIFFTFSQHSDGSTCNFEQRNDSMVEWQKFTQNPKHWTAENYPTF